MTMSQKRKRVTTSQKHYFPSKCDNIFKLACPVKEDDWIPGWRELREIVYTKSGLAELGCVFKTKDLAHLMGPAIWVNNIFEPFSRIQYSAVNENLVYQIQWDLNPIGDGCEVILNRTWTALTKNAEEFLVRMETTMLQKPPDLFSLIDCFLTTGRMRQT